MSRDKKSVFKSWFKSAESSRGKSRDAKLSIDLPGTSAQLPSYKYSQLTSTTSIRLLTVDSEVVHDDEFQDQRDAPSSVRSRPVFRMMQVDLLRTPLYTAVSHMWNLSELTEELIIDGCRLIVGRHLKEMISSLVDAGLRALWIDAICINQSDLSERGSQVRLMGEIYTKANYVVAFVSAKSADEDFHCGPFRRVLSVLLADWEADDHEHSFTDISSIHENFFCHRYFSRRWIIQEICLARHVVIFYDHLQIPISTLKTFFHTPIGRHFHASPAALLNGLRTRIEFNDDGPTNLEQLLYEHEHAQCSEPLDTVYALLSLTDVAKEHLQVDYNADRLQALFDILRVCTEAENMSSSRIFGLACLLRRSLKISTTSLDECLHGTKILHSGLKTVLLQSEIYRRSVYKSQTMHINVDELICAIRACVPSMYQYNSIPLKSTAGTDSMEALTLSFVKGQEAEAKKSGSQHIEEIHCGNLWAFPLTPSHESFSQLAGFSTVPLEDGDELWQFALTPLAMVARKTPDGFRLIGRALLLEPE